MFGLFKKKKPRVQAGGLTFDGSEAQFRKRAEMLSGLKVFISHRWGHDEDVLEAISNFESYEAGINLIDLSITSKNPTLGPRGGQVNQAEIYDKVVEQMNAADIIVAPSKRTMDPSEWVRKELETAVFWVDKPILFVDHFEGQQIRTTMMTELEKVGGRIYHSKADKLSITIAIQHIVSDILSRASNAAE